MADIGEIEFYKKTQEDQKFNADKAWESMKFCVTLCSALFSITVGLLGAIGYSVLIETNKSMLILLLIFLPILSIITIGVTKRNFRRECERMYESVAILMKIEDKLLKRTNIECSHFFEEDKLTPKRWDEVKYATTEKFVKAMMYEKKDTFYSTMKPVFYTLTIFSIILIVGLPILAYLSL